MVLWYELVVCVFESDLLVMVHVCRAVYCAHLE